jgi:hypothetical protein
LPFSVLAAQRFVDERTATQRLPPVVKKARVKKTISTDAALKNNGRVIAVVAKIQSPKCVLTQYFFKTSRKTWFASYSYTTRSVAFLQISMATASEPKRVGKCEA